VKGISPANDSRYDLRWLLILLNAERSATLVCLCGPTRQMIAALWQRGFLSLAISLAGACALLVASKSTIDTVRMSLLDAVRPGSEALVIAREWGADSSTWLRSNLQRFAAVNSPATAASPDTAPELLQVAHAKQLQLESQLAQARAELADARAENSRLIEPDDTKPLVAVSAVRARVIGRSREEIVQLADRLVGAGRSDGVSTADLVVQVAHTNADSTTTEPVIDQGSNAAIEADLPVASGGILVGRVRTAGRLTSSIQLVIDGEFRIGARLMRDTPVGPVFGATGLFAGGGEAGCRLELVSSGEPVAAGDRVYTQENLAGQSVSLLIGTVVTAEVRPGESHWSITVKPACDQVPPQVDVLKLELNTARVEASSQTTTAPTNATEAAP
jgi:cell shape-determining protein MreC